MSNTAGVLTIATFNIRYDNPADGINVWPKRREWVRDLMDYHEFDVVGVQEAMAHQVDFLTEKRFDFVGAGRDDGKRGGEFSAVLFDRKRFDRVDSGTFWLSETPDVPSRGWDADLNRVCSWARLRDTATKREFCHFNTHFDHKGVVARERSADLILKKIESIAAKSAFFLTGDFNLVPASAPIRTLSAALRDARAITEARPYGPYGTFNGFDIKRPLGTRIDYIFVSPQVRVHRYAAVPDNWDLRYPSDHLPVVIRAEIAP